MYGVKENNPFGRQTKRNTEQTEYKAERKIKLVELNEKLYSFRFIRNSQFKESGQMSG